MIYITMFIVLTKIVVGQIPTPCSEIFSYEPTESGSDRWYGEIRYSAPSDITGIWLQITLDRPADILGNWFGQVATCDNTVFVIRKPGYSLKTGQYFSLRFFVKFNLAKPIPSLKTIKFNGNEICTEEKNKPNKVELISNSEVVEIHQKPANIPPETSPPTAQPPRTSLSDDELKSNCGIVATRATPLIFGGHETSPGQWPWHAALYHHDTYEIKYVCGATLITQQHVITAAHCVSDSGTKTVKDSGDISVGLGKYNLKTYEEDFQHVGISDIFVHPKYNPWKLYNDVAILKLSSPVLITNFVRPCCLWDEDSNLANIIGREGVVVGWGLNGNKSHRLMEAAMPIVSTRDCIFSKKEFREFLNENNFCAGSRNGTTACRGDSGGAIVFPKTEANGQTVWYIRGIVSLSLVPEILEICETSNYNIFTDVAKFTQWIKKIIYN